MKLFTLLFSIFFSLQLSANNLFPELKNWELKSETEKYTPDNLWGIINGAADKYLQFNFEELNFGVYRNKEGVEINVYIYQHADINNAFGIYRTERFDNFTENGIGTQGYTVDETVNFFKGKFYVKLYSNTKGTAPEIEKLAKAISKKINTGSWPEAFDLFPLNGLQKKSITYVSGNLLGLSFMPPAFLADYEMNDEKYQVFIIEKESAYDCQQVISDYMAFTKQYFPIDEKTVLTITDKYNGSIYLVWNARHIYGIAGEPSQKTVDLVTSGFM